MSHKFPYRWNLTDGYPAKGINPNGLKVFGTFICGGGSTMGYKLAGYDHLGGVEIDKKVSAVYRANHHPKYLFTEDLRAFNQRNDLPAELYDLDILDGSPPCSTFSMAGKREKGWGKEKKFREGQILQTLDDLVFIYCNTIKKLQPKVFILENVKGMLHDKARAYVHQIMHIMNNAGYACQIFLLNAASMGVPQRRERVFIIGRKKELAWPDLKMQFDEPGISFSKIIDRTDDKNGLTERQNIIWNNKIKSDKSLGDVNMRIYKKLSGFTCPLVNSIEICPTINSQGGCFMIYDIPRQMNNKECCLVSSFPLDYDFNSVNVRYMVGMSVPPVMTAQISHQIYLQWFRNFTENLQR